MKSSFKKIKHYPDERVFLGIQQNLNNYRSLPIQPYRIVKKNRFIQMSFSQCCGNRTTLKFVFSYFQTSFIQLVIVKFVIEFILYSFIFQ